MAAVLFGLLAHNYGNRATRPRRQLRGMARTWRFTVLIIAVVVVTQLVQRAENASSPGAVAVASFVILTATSWWFTRRLEGDEAGPSVST